MLRLTLLHTPKAKAYPYQIANDLGRHRFVYAIAGHAGDWRAGQVPRRAAALNQPLVSFQPTVHPGALGRSVSMLSVDEANGQVAVRAVKKAEDADAIVVRLQELYGRQARARVRFPARIIEAREINAAEEPIGPFPATDNEITVELKPYQPRSFALRLQTSVPAAAVASAVPLDLPFNLDGISKDGARADGDFDGRKQTLAAELLPTQLTLDGVPFEFGSSAPKAANVLVPKGQRLTLPPGRFNRLYLVAAAVGGDVATAFAIDGPTGSGVPASQARTIRDWQGPVGQWDSTLKEPRLFHEVYVPPITRGQSWAQDAIAGDMVVSWDLASGTVNLVDQIRPGFVKRDEIAWVGGHRHAPDGNQPYLPAYLFLCALDLPAGATSVRLPNDERLRILAATVARVPPAVRPAMPLYGGGLAEPGIK